MNLFADYRQIHVFDFESEADLGDAWTDRAVADHLAIGEDVVGIGTVVNVNVAVTVAVLDGRPADDSTDFDHVAECSLDCPSGTLVVMGCTDYEPEAQRFEVTPGALRLRISQANLDAAYAADMIRTIPRPRWNACGCRSGRLRSVHPSW